MIHFIFVEKRPEYMFLKGDNEQDNALLSKFKEHCNLVDPKFYMLNRGHKGEPPREEYVFEYIKLLDKNASHIFYCSKNLWYEAFRFFKDVDHPFDGLKENAHLFKRKLQHSFEQFKEIVDSWHMKYTPRPYQYEIAYDILQWRSSLSELATRAGKTLLTYIVFRYAREYLGAKKLLMIVPSITLVTQGKNDFDEYGEFFKTEQIWGGGEIIEGADLTIGTFNSLYKFIDRKDKKYNPSFFDNYDCVCVDETHRATAAQIREIISQPFMQRLKVAFGISGTLPKPKTTDYFCVHAELGHTIHRIKAKELQDAGYISNIFIHQVRFEYKDILQQQKLFVKCAEYALSTFVYKPTKDNKRIKIPLKNPEFQIKYEKTFPDAILQIRTNCENAATINNVFDEQRFYELYVNALTGIITNTDTTNMFTIERMISHFMPLRTQYICEKIVPRCNGNTIMLAFHVEYIAHIVEVLKQRFPDKIVLTITGSVNEKKRNKIKDIMKENNNVILVASYGTMSTGITLSNLCYGVLLESFRSEVTNMQSLGRGLGLSDMKSRYEVYDLIDCYDKTIGHTLKKQGDAKVLLYKEQEYPCKIEKVKI